MRESVFQKRFLDRLREILPGVIILKNDANYLQGFPDYTVLYGPRWAALEFKKDKDAPFRPNQKYYIDVTREMSYSAAVYPENAGRVLYEIQRALRSSGRARVLKW